MNSLGDEDRDFLHFLLSLEKAEFEMMVNSMTESEAMQVLFLIQMAKEEIFNDQMVKDGMQEAKEVIDKIKRML